MKASETNFLGFLKKANQLVIPIYQRTYSWTKRECRQLWDDILRTGSDDTISAHFTGSIVYIEKDINQITVQSPHLIIDGQQRLTTVMLILEALARRVGSDEPVAGFSAEKIRNYYLLNLLEKDDNRFKLLLTHTDKQSLLTLIQQKPKPAEPSHQILESFTFFKNRIQTLEMAELKSLCKGLAKLSIVDIALKREHDNPQLIYESMNSTGLELSQADLIRNFILMGLDPDHQKRLYAEFWRPMEVAFGQESYGTQFNRFIRHYLTYKTGEIPKIRAVYEAFKVYARPAEVATTDMDELVEDIHTYAGYYCKMAFGKEDDKDLATAFMDLRILKVDVAFPFLLELYHDYVHSHLSKSDFVCTVRYIEAYVFRRAVCAVPTSSYNKTFAAFGRALNKHHYIHSIQVHFLKLPSYRRFPSDKEFKNKLYTSDLYNFARRNYWLRRLENHDKKEKVSVNEYTIEHILPQNKNLSLAWRKALGREWQQVQEKYLHTIGNLTLTGYNSEYGDRPFSEKRGMEGGFKDSPLWLNKKLRDLNTWDEKAIKQRAVRLAKKAVQVWATPPLPPKEILETLSSNTEATAQYTLDDHPNLAHGSTIRQLFDTFRNEVLKLDSCISEEILKTYIAYKAETNFADVLPQKSKLKLWLNIQFHELHDHKGMAKDVTNIGHSGNGDAEVILNTLQEIPYVIGLVRQAFEKQLGNGEV